MLKTRNQLYALEFRRNKKHYYLFLRSQMFEIVLATYLCKNSRFMVMPINKEKLEARAKVAKSRPDFKRPESWRYKR